MSYKVLIVDDDSIVRIGLKSVVDWQKLDLEIIGEASDGVEAYELISRLRPDIVLTDMHMPRSDGVRLMEQAKRDFPDTLFLVLSCYNDLEYVKESMKLGAFDYLLKDEIVNTDKLTRILQNAISALEASRGRKLAAFFPSQEYLPSCVLRKRFLADLLEGKVQDPHMIAAASEELQLRFDENPPFFVILELDDYVGVLRRFVDTDALDYAVKKTLLRDPKGIRAYGVFRRRPQRLLRPGRGLRAQQYHHAHAADPEHTGARAHVVPQGIPLLLHDIRRPDPFVRRIDAELSAHQPCNVLRNGQRRSRPDLLYVGTPHPSGA